MLFCDWDQNPLWAALSQWIPDAKALFGQSPLFTTHGHTVQTKSTFYLSNPKGLNFNLLAMDQDQSFELTPKSLGFHSANLSLWI